MSTNASVHDVIILGGGPAGLSAALWCVELGLKSVLIDENEGLGGQLSQIYNPINNYIGIQAANGRELADRFLQHIDEIEVGKVLGIPVEKVDLASHSIMMGDGRGFSARALILATGVKRRRLRIPGEEEFDGKGMIRSGTRELDSLTNKIVIVVGGGDAALENAQILGSVASKVYVSHRGEAFSARTELIQAAAALANVEFLFSTTLESIHGTDRIASVELYDRRLGNHFDLPVDAVLVRIGVEPNSDQIRGQIALDDAGYVVVDASCKTGIPGVFAAGDIASPVSPTISTAVGMGATAAKSTYHWLRFGNH